MTERVQFRRPADGYPESIRLADAVSAGDRDGVVAALAAIPAAGDRGCVQRLVAASCRRIDVETRDIGSPEGRSVAVLAAHGLVVQAWTARGTGSSDETSPGQFRRFRDLLVRAERILVNVVAADPGHADAWDLRIVTARGLGLGLGEIRRRHQRLVELAPTHLPAHQDMLVALCPRWFGTWPEAFEHAREVSAAAAPGSLGAALILIAHLEGWVEKGPDYLAQDAVVDEVVEAGRASVFHPDFVPVPGWREVHASFALFFSLVGMTGHAAAHFRELGDHHVEGPWSYLEDPPRQYALRPGMALGATR